MEILNAEPYRDEVIYLLSLEKLPVIDLPQTLDDFFVALENNEVIGTIGIEKYGSYGLIRSLVVKDNHRNKGIAGELLNKVESVATEKDLQGLYLLTETALDYFNNKGFEHVARMDVPEEVKTSAQFSITCPESAIAMAKNL